MKIEEGGDSIELKEMPFFRYRGSEKAPENLDHL